MSGEKKLGNGLGYYNADDVPPKYKEELEAIMTNVEKIHGPLFVQHLKFSLNLKTLLEMVGNSMDVREGVNRKQLENIMGIICTQLNGSHADACHLDGKEQVAVVKTMDTIDSLTALMAKDGDR